MKPRIIIGVDLEAGSSPVLNPRYSAVVLREGEVYSEHTSIGIGRLVRLAWDHRPEIIATDNIRELGAHDADIARLAGLLPPDTHIVQVTRIKGEFVDIREAARLAGLTPPPGKPDPLDTARLAALIAYKGYGTQVRIIEEKTRIVVARGRRSPSPGGMSQQRYNRRVRAALLRIARDIKKKLDAYGFDYDAVYRRSEGGLERALFIVYAPRDMLQGIVKPHRGHDVRIEITPVYSSKIIYEDEISGKTYERHLVVGIDPGITTGIAVLDLDGRPLLLKSGKDLDRARILSLISRMGTPVILAVDTAAVPDSVRKLAASLNVPVYSPSHDLPTTEKHEIALIYNEKYGVRADDSHKRDALAAAVRAYRSLEPKLRQAEAYASKIGVDLSLEKIKALVARGRTVAEAVEEEIERIFGETTRQEHEAAQSPVQSSEPSSVEKALADEVLELKKERARLRMRIRELEEKVAELEYALMEKNREISIELARDRSLELLRDEVKLLTDKIARLEDEVEKARRTIRRFGEVLQGVKEGRLVIVRAVDKLTGPTVKTLRGAAGEPVIVRNPNIYEKNAVTGLAEMGLAGILMLEKHEMGLARLLRSLGIPVAYAGDLAVYDAGDIVVVDSEALSRLEEDRRRIEEERKIDLASIIEDYRKKRLRELLEPRRAGHRPPRTA